MMSDKILVVDDDEGVLCALKMLLKSEGYFCTTADDPEAALEQISKNNFALVLMDLNYARDTTSGEEGLNLIRSIQKVEEDLPVVVMTGWGTIEIAVKAMQIGACDFIQKPWENERLLAILKTQLKYANAQRRSKRLSQQNEILQEELSSRRNLITESSAMKSLIATLNRVAQSDVNVLITGENGTGKSMFARYLHDASPRKNASFISVNMGAIAESLFESEMFGHVRGAFTDAKTERIGRFELAHKGTLFLDEIANTNYLHQGKLLRVLEDKQFERVGSSKTATVDIRLICATNTDMDKAVSAGEFRKDLFYRINTVEVCIPPLRERVADIYPLAEAFLKELSRKYSRTDVKFSNTAKSTLESYSWPGNIRELNHVIERTMILSGSNILDPQELTVDSAAKYKNIDNDVFQNLKSMEELQDEVIKTRLSYFDGDALKAADSLGMSRSAFYRRIKKQRTLELFNEESPPTRS